MATFFGGSYINESMGRCQAQTAENRISQIQTAYELDFYSFSDFAAILDLALWRNLVGNITMAQYLAAVLLFYIIDKRSHIKTEWIKAALLVDHSSSNLIIWRICINFIDAECI